jgi:hypothetical protein
MEGRVAEPEVVAESLELAAAARATMVEARATAAVARAHQPLQALVASPAVATAVSQATLGRPMERGTRPPKRAPTVQTKMVRTPPATMP